jgi:hypothetical protein
MRSLLDYETIKLKGARNEFLVVARRDGKFRPVISSENAGADLIGFASSSSYLRRGELTISDTVREDNEDFQVIELKVSTSSGPSLEKVALFWRGGHPVGHHDEEIRRIGEINLSSVFAENSDGDREAELPDGFLQWHLGAIDYIIGQSNKLAEEREKRRRANSFRVVFGSASISAFGAMIAITITLVLASSDFAALIDALGLSTRSGE